MKKSRSLKKQINWNESFPAWVLPVLFLRAFFFLTDEILNLKSLNPLNEKKSFLFYFFTRKRIQSYLEWKLRVSECMKMDKLTIALFIIDWELILRCWKRLTNYLNLLYFLKVSSVSLKKSCYHQIIYQLLVISELPKKYHPNSKDLCSL